MDRIDVEEYSEDVICVSLYRALCFLFNLLSREEDAFAHLHARMGSLKMRRIGDVSGGLTKFSVMLERPGLTLMGSLSRWLEELKRA